LLPTARFAVERRDVAAAHEPDVGVHPRERHPRDEGRRARARGSRGGRGDARVRPGDRVGRAVLRLGEAQAGRQHLARVVPDGHAPQECRAAQQQPRADEQHEGEGNFSADERGARAAAYRPHLRPPALLQRGEQRPPAELRGREQPQE
jgi:hypothetical protein